MPAVDNAVPDPSDGNGVDGGASDTPAMAGIDSSKCAVCGADHDDPEFAAAYTTLVCRRCDDRAVTSDGNEPWFDTWSDSGENPVFIDGIRCWRRYRFGGFVTMRDPWDCSDIGEFYERIGFV